uniref:glutathione-specific gamma-glutamylcyclotransferase n=2 Tax=Lepeophtheirus salmonis TaxID=72036 RepID=D3PIH2_LEPSM|nr:Cation transport regulator-like protein 2 [Lepeophtheirus salmonis]
MSKLIWLHITFRAILNPINKVVIIYPKGDVKMVWLFGYGSLIWKTNFNYVKMVKGYVKGYKRRFWWWSLDHRGVPGAPGRVVNLIPSENEDEEVWGVAYEIPDDDWIKTVGPALDHREKGGYSRRESPFYYVSEDNGSPIKSLDVIFYIGSLSDDQYAGPDSLEVMAKTIYSSVGPSGPNKEYLFNLSESLKTICGVEDPHVTELEKAVQEIVQKELSV